jgi:DNA-binding MarR family transcriptional regulator
MGPRQSRVRRAKPQAPESRAARNSGAAATARGLQAELKQTVPFSSPEQEAYLSLLRTADALQSAMESRLKEFALTGTQYNALRILRGAGVDGLPCSEIGERMITHDPDITRLLNRLQKRGLAERIRCKRDRRVIYGKITSEGLKLLREMDEPVERYGREMLHHLSQAELRKLIDLLELVRDSQRAG